MNLAYRLRVLRDIISNILRSSYINLNLSSYNQLEGKCDFNATPLVSPRTRVLIHDKLKQRHYWDTHGVSD